jgi:phospholipid/cholesterol/gamma-HCH transport system substrate-binding protein
MKVSAERNAWRAFAGFLILSACACLIWYLRTVSSYMPYMIHTGDSVSGLLIDAPVEYHGVEVGRVSKIELNGPDAVSIWLNIRKGTPITTATVATITARGLASRGFMGYVYIALENSSVRPDAGLLSIASTDAIPSIPTTPSRSINLDTAINQVNENVQILTNLVQSALSNETVESFKDSIANLQKVTHTLAANSEKLNVILSNADLASKQVKPLLDASNNTVHVLQTQVLPQAYRTLTEINTASQSLNSLTGRINRNPSILIRGNTLAPLGPGEKDVSR